MNEKDDNEEYVLKLRNMFLEIIDGKVKRNPGIFKNRNDGKLAIDMAAMLFMPELFEASPSVNRHMATKVKTVMKRHMNKYGNQKFMSIHLLAEEVKEIGFTDEQFTECLEMLKIDGEIVIINKEIIRAR